MQTLLNDLRGSTQAANPVPFTDDELSAAARSFVRLETENRRGPENIGNARTILRVLPLYHLSVISGVINGLLSLLIFSAAVLEKHVDGHAATWLLFAAGVFGFRIFVASRWRERVFNRPKYYERLWWAQALAGAAVFGSAGTWLIPAASAPYCAAYGLLLVLIIGSVALQSVYNPWLFYAYSATVLLPNVALMASEQWIGAPVLVVLVVGWALISLIVYRIRLHLEQPVLFALHGHMMLDRLRRREDELRVNEQRLQAALSDSKQSIDDKLSFVGNVSHDMSQPLRAIEAMAEALRRDAGRRAPALAESARDIELAAKAANALLRDILVLAKLEARREEPRLRVVAAATVFDELSYWKRAASSARGLHLTFKASKGLMLHTDHDLLKRILTNLIDNAIKYSDYSDSETSSASTGRILVSARRIGHTAQIRVWDTGPGIEEGMEEDIFTRFFRHPAQLEALREGGVPGAGIGLAIARMSAQVIGSDLYVIPMRRRGAVFEMRVGLAAPGVAAETQVEPTEGSNIRRSDISLTSPELS